MPSSLPRQRRPAFDQTLANLQDRQDYVKVLKEKLPEHLKDKFYKFDPDRYNLTLIQLLLILIGGVIESLAVRLEINAWIIYIPFSIVSGNAICSLLFNSHYICHAQNIFHNKRAYIWTLLGLTPLWMSPTLWKIIHNQLHHNFTNGSNDPDRCYTISEGRNWGRLAQDFGVPSNTVSSPAFILGLATNWGTHAFRNIIAALFSKQQPLNHTTADILVSRKTKLKIFTEYLAIASLHLSYIILFANTLPSFLLGYLLPIWIGYGIAISYIYTNHFLCPLTEINDTLVNTTSLKIPKFIDKLHLNFSHHVEHHLFPTINTDYYPEIRKLLIETYPNDFRLFSFKEAYNFLFATPRVHINDVDLKDGRSKVVLDVSQHTWHKELEDSVTS